MFTAFVSLYKELLEPTHSAGLIVLDNLCVIFECSEITDLIQAMFGFSDVFGWYIVFSEQSVWHLNGRFYDHFFS